MADDNRMNDVKRIYRGHGGTDEAGRPDTEAVYSESPYDASRPDSPYSPYGGFGDSPDTHIGGTQPIPIKKGLFDGISVAQVIAASAAAATSMLLASRIGIAGSVIGAAVSSMVTVVCSQLYRNALDASARKLKAKQMSHALEQGAARDFASTEGTCATDEGTAGAPQIRIAPTKLRARAAAERSASKRKVAAFSALIALAAVAASAGIIMLTTSGRGLGAKAPSIFGSRPTDSQTAPATAGDAVEAPEMRADPGTPDDRPEKSENGAGSGGSTGTGADGSAGGGASGAPDKGETAQQDGSTAGAGDSTSGQTGAGSEGADDGAPTSANGKPASGTDGTAGSANAATPVPLKGDAA